jgi:hypothetical protein
MAYSRANLSAANVHVRETQPDPPLAPWRLGATAFTAIGSVAATIAMIDPINALRSD